MKTCEQCKHYHELSRTCRRHAPSGIMNMAGQYIAQWPEVGQFRDLCGDFDKKELK